MQERHTKMGVRQLLLLLAGAQFLSTAFCQCSEDKTHSRDKRCIEQFFKLQESLLNDTAMKYTLAQVFYPGSSIRPTLLYVAYNITFTNNSERYRSGCNQSNLVDVTKSHELVFGWSDRSIYNFFHPAVIDQLRYHLPFWILSLSNAILSDEPNADAFLWEGLGSLSSVTLNITVEANACLTQDILNSSVYELTEYLRIYADNGLYKYIKGNSPLIKVDMTHNAEALANVMVLNYHNDSSFSTDAKYGMKLLEIGYIICFLTAAIVLPMFVIVTGESFKGIIINKQEDGNWPKSKCMLLSFTLIIFIINILAIIAECHQLSELSRKNNSTNFSRMKIVCLCLLLFESVSVSIVYTAVVYFHQTPRGIAAPFLFLWFALCSITFFFSTVFLGIIPLLILVFAYPIDTSALVTLHYTMIYSSTVVLATMIYYDGKMLEYCSGNNGNTKHGVSCIKVCTLFLMLYIVLVGIAALLTIAFIYIYTLLMFQILVSRYNLSDDIAKAFSTFFPSIVITLTTYFLDKHIFKPSEQIVRRRTVEKDLASNNFINRKVEYVITETINTIDMPQHKGNIA